MSAMHLGKRFFGRPGGAKVIEDGNRSAAQIALCLAWAEFTTVNAKPQSTDIHFKLVTTVTLSRPISLHSI